MSFLQRHFGLSTEEEESVAKTVGRVQSIGDFLADVVEGAKVLPFVKALSGLSPWVDAIGGSVTDAVPAVKFVASVLDRVTGRNDPNELGRLAFTIAYQHSLVQAAQVFGRRPDALYVAVDPRAVARQLRNLSASMTEEVLDFCRSPLSDALLHPFVKRADDMLRTSALAAGFMDDDVLRLQHELHQRFIVHLQTLLSHRDTAQKFEPFRTRLELGTGANAAVLALTEHAQYHRALYQEAPVFGSEPFALQHIYTELARPKRTAQQRTPYLKGRSNSSGFTLSARANFRIVDNFGSLAPGSIWPIWSSFILATSANCSSVQPFPSRISRRCRPKSIASGSQLSFERGGIG
jgi:hypothetical protein